MRILRYIATRAGLVLAAVAVLGGASIAYAITRSTTEVPSSFVAVEATFGLTVLHSGDQPLAALEFGEVVQGEDSRTSFAVRNDGNARVQLGLRVRHNATIYGTTESCVLTRQTRATSLASDQAQQLRKEHQALHDKLGTLDTAEKRQIHEKLHARLDEIRKNTHLSVVKGHRITVPSLATFCFVVAPGHPKVAAALPPGGKVPVVVGLRADPDVTLGLQQFTILVDANDRSE